jgi:hypothetical protein
MKFLYSILLTSFFFVHNCYGQQIRKNSLYKLMQGRWYELKDAKSRIDISRRFIKEYYSGVKGMDTLSYTITRESCDTTVNSTKGTGYYLKETNRDGLVYCYAIVKVSVDELEMVYSGGRIIFYRRMGSGKQP